MRVLPGGVSTTAPRLPLLKSYAFFIAFLVLCPFAPRRSSSGNDPNGISSPAVDNDQDATRSIGTDRCESFFVGMLVSYGQRSRVEEHADRVSEIDACFRRLAAAFALFHTKSMGGVFTAVHRVK